MFDIRFNEYSHWNPYIYRSYVQVSSVFIVKVCVCVSVRENGLVLEAYQIHAWQHSLANRFFLIARFFSLSFSWREYFYGFPFSPTIIMCFPFLFTTVILLVRYVLAHVTTSIKAIQTRLH